MNASDPDPACPPRVASPTARPRALPARVGAQAQSQTGVTLPELLVAFVIVAVVGGIGAMSLHRFSEQGKDPQMQVVAAQVWTGIEAYRQDHSGTFPPANLIVGGTGQSLVGPSGTRYIGVWPKNPSTSAPLSIASGGGANPPASGAKDSVVYWTDGVNGWLAAYRGNGKLSYDRGSTSGNGVRPIG